MDDNSTESTGDATIHEAPLEAPVHIEEPASEAQSDPVGEVRKPSATDEIVDAWFHSTFPGTAIAGETANWNFLSQARDALKARLNAETKP